MFPSVFSSDALVSNFLGHFIPGNAVRPAVPYVCHVLACLWYPSPLTPSPSTPYVFLYLLNRLKIPFDKLAQRAGRCKPWFCSTHVSVARRNSSVPYVHLFYKFRVVPHVWCVFPFATSLVFPVKVVRFNAVNVCRILGITVADKLSTVLICMAPWLVRRKVVSVIHTVPI